MVNRVFVIRRSGRFGVRLMVAWLSFRLAYNVLGLGEVADFEALNFQASIKVDSRKNVRLITDPAFFAKRLLYAVFLSSFYSIVHETLRPSPYSKSL